MQKLISFSEISIHNNQVDVDPVRSSMEDSVITFNGSGNILVIEDGVRIKKSKISFNGNNSLVYLSKNKNNVYLNASVHSNNILFLGENIFFNGILNVSCSEEKNILIGSDCLISFGVWIRTADPHLIYDSNTNTRINPSLSVFIGDHVWIGQQSLILKGAKVGSGSIIGAGAVVPNKRIGCNEIWAGNPARKIKENIFWSGECVHNFTKEKTHKYDSYDREKNLVLFSTDKRLRNFETLDTIDSATSNSCKSKLLMIKQMRNSFSEREYPTSDNQGKSILNPVKHLIKKII